MIDPSRYYEVKGQVEPVRTQPAQLALGSNASVVAAVTGKRIRVLGFTAQGDGSAGRIAFKDGSGGTRLFGPLNIPSSATPETYFLPVIDSGYFETSTGVGLFADVGAFGGAVNLNVFYIEYTP